MNYSHTQYGHLHWLLLLPATAMLIAATWLARLEPTVAAILTATGAVLLLASLMFGRLTVRDEGQWLALRYGPLPVFRKRIRYADITAAEPARTAILDGWGIHWCPGRGWTYNLWGFDCVRLTLGRRTVRVGTDDPQGLAAFLREKLPNS
jgi:hypothetical protein